MSQGLNLGLPGFTLNQVYMELTNLLECVDQAETDVLFVQQKPASPVIYNQFNTSRVRTQALPLWWVGEPVQVELRSSREPAWAQLEF